MSHKPFSTLRAGMSNNAQARSRARTDAMRVAMTLAEVRKARGLTQADVAATIGSAQAAVSKVERREDMYVSSLQRQIEALGGELLLIASFPDATIPVNIRAKT